MVAAYSKWECTVTSIYNEERCVREVWINNQLSKKINSTPFLLQLDRR